MIVARILLFAGCMAVIAAAITGLPEGTPAIVLPTATCRPTGQISADPGRALASRLRLGSGGTCLRGINALSSRVEAGWLFGAAMSLIGALGVFGLQDGASFLIAWEIMSFGGAVMILSEKLSADVGRPVLFMLGLLEVGAVALIAAILAARVSRA